MGKDLLLNAAEQNGADFSGVNQSEYQLFRSERRETPQNKSPGVNQSELLRARRMWAGGTRKREQCSDVGDEAGTRDGHACHCSSMARPPSANTTDSVAALVLCGSPVCPSFFVPRH